MSATLKVELADGKYTVVQEANGSLHALRNGEPWRDLTGDKLVLALAQEHEQLREQFEGAQAEVIRLTRANTELAVTIARLQKEVQRFGAAGPFTT